MRDLDKALAGFSQEIGPSAWRDTVVVVISKFSRTLRENGDRCTDHGRVYWVMGDRILNEQIDVEQPKLFQKRDYR
jgi:uncharacterized protein (DUF1501 family)